MKNKVLLLIVIFGLLLFGGILYFNFFQKKLTEVQPSSGCAAEGKTIGAAGMPTKCCDGLKPLTGKGGYGGDCPEPLSLGGLLICNACGNGVCDTQYNENKCNCPEDCTGTEKPCINYPAVEEENSGQCCPGLKKIEIGDYDSNCLLRAKGMSVCFPCGDGYCAKDYGENKCNCPEDCK